MDDDITLAIRLQANESGIYDEEIIESLVEEFKNHNYSDVNELIDDTFDIIDENDIFEYNNISYSRNTPNYRQIIDLFGRVNNAFDSEVINSTIQRNLSRQYMVQNNHPQTLQPQSVNSIMNMLFGNSPIQNPQPYFPSMTNGSGFISIGGISGPQGIMASAMPMNFFEQPFSSTNIGNSFTQIGNFMNQLNGLNALFPEPVTSTLTSGALNNIQDITYQEIKNKLPNIDINEQCAICFAKLTEDQETNKYNILPCEHTFHSACIKEYLKEYDYHCPICKEECGEHAPKTKIDDSLGYNGNDDDDAIDVDVDGDNEMEYTD